ncbi:bifunctional phosphopantothenoylcysteine decarboxylase/phosphopantothenate--cysteine ligase CoaBC [Natranaerofaba carboxydovora]|uniref:bifunctional phosphopantothenoylcysteine decarboxylase/phosphopantothenate--cysteine ligase CoaBC n=1 Tax=Natranaerofaba carboxydovora TaxID=2742683 RepID=UPI001F12C240|nr:bifunctional phosphopantothenoylcysteine decarboxylase/phosphopantothenate--cysteine ligase CoaBC [Natranaerofaba carboxydovora]UMZ73294.1 Coenzyme A biosynthesis bifunctional protein CoaBC [Natranaerofaba carboxydovora]
MGENNKVVLGVTGGISAYKSADVCSKLKKRGYQVKVVMTKSAAEFIRPLTFETISQNSVTTEMFSQNKPYLDTEHISLARWGDIYLICPATANIIGKLANGIADDFLSTMLLAVESQVIIAPAMNSSMYKNPIVEENINKLKNHGYYFIKPDEGMLACGEEGAGRLPDSQIICDEVDDRIKKTVDQNIDNSLLKGKKVIVTAGATRENIDPVRYITNPSSGKMGYAVARAFINRGAIVTLIAASTDEKPPDDLHKVIRAFSAKEMYEKVMENLEDCDIVIKAAAVSDFTPKNYKDNKLKKEGKNEMVLELTSTRDILKEIGDKKGDRILVGFAAETSDLTQNAKDKLNRKNLDLIVANDITAEDAGFSKDINTAKLIFKDGNMLELDTMKKAELGEKIAKTVEKIIKEKNRP